MKKEYKGFMPGDIIKVNRISDVRKDMEGKTGIIEFIDDIGQLHTSISSVALIPEQDDITLVSGKRNGNQIFRCSGGYIAFLHTIYVSTGAVAIYVVSVDRNGSIIGIPELITVNGKKYGYETLPDKVFLHYDYVSYFKEYGDIFVKYFTDGQRFPVMHGFAKSRKLTIVTLNDDFREKMKEFK